MGGRQWGHKDEGTTDRAAGVSKRVEYSIALESLLTLPRERLLHSTRRKLVQLSAARYE
jgi:hypothetical protein